MKTSTMVIGAAAIAAAAYLLISKKGGVFGGSIGPRWKMARPSGASSRTWGAVPGFQGPVKGETWGGVSGPAHGATWGGYSGPAHGATWGAPVARSAPRWDDRSSETGVD